MHGRHVVKGPWQVVLRSRPLDLWRVIVGMEAKQSIQICSSLV